MESHTTHSFEVEIPLQEKNTSIFVETKETTDGVPYYQCSQGGQQLSEIRKEASGKWLQLWGTLTPQEIESLGKAIEARLPQ